MSAFIKLYINNFYCSHGVPLLVLITIWKVSVVHDSLDDGFKADESFVNIFMINFHGQLYKQTFYYAALPQGIMCM